MLAPPSVVGTDDGHGWLPLDGDEAAVVFGACDELLEPSPGNCEARCGLSEADALMPTVPDVLSLFAALGDGTGTVVGIVLAGTLSGSEPQPVPVPPAGWLFDEHGVSLRLVPPVVGWLATVGPVGDTVLPGAVVPAAVPVVVVLGIAVEFCDEVVWACAAPQLARHRMTAEANMRCIASSFSKKSMGVPAECSVNGARGMTTRRDRPRSQWNIRS